MLDETRLKEIEARCEAALEPPGHMHMWKNKDDGSCRAFLVNAPLDIPDLLAEVRRLQNTDCRNQIAGLLLTARGWIECWINCRKNYQDETVEVRAGNLSSSVEWIDKVLALLGHKAHGTCNPDWLPTSWHTDRWGQL